jgi:hypothetical protein
VLLEFWSANLRIKNLTGRVWDWLAWTKLAPIEFQCRHFGQSEGREFHGQMSDYDLHSGLLLPFPRVAIFVSRPADEGAGGGGSSRSHRVQNDSGNGCKAAGG